MVGGLRDVITCAQFQIEIFMGYDFTGGRIFDFPIDFSMGLTTVQRYCAACDTARYWSKIVFFHTPLHLTPALGVSPSEYCHPVLCSKTRMVWLPDGEKKFEDTCNRFDRIAACDGQTDGQTEMLPWHSPCYAYV